MTAISDHTINLKPRGPLRRLRHVWLLISHAFGRIAPKGLYTRALLIIIAPIVLLQSILAFVFMERHWESVTRRLSIATTQDIALLVDGLETLPEAQHESLTSLARQHLNLVVQMMPPDELPAARPKQYFDLLNTTLSEEIKRRIGLPFWIDTLGGSRHVEIRLRLQNSVMRILVPRSQTYASNSHIFLVWMGATSIILLGIAILFLRNQIKPILALADAADRFGRGHAPQPDFKVRGAREVRQASQAFLEMRDRIQRHVEQRTTMLAGVSHDLRTILTRFRLQLAIMPARDAEPMRADVDEMQQMLEDYLAFAKGDSGEKMKRINIKKLLEEVRAGAPLGKTFTIEVRDDPVIMPLRRNSFKRAVSNLVVNAARYADTISIKAVKTRRWFTITVEDNGPGIPEAKREEVFRPFHSLDGSRNQNVKSTGLGLAIVRDIVRGHGGEITLGESAMGGLKAHIRIPV
ncbi:MAG: ATP-binding protein [Hyphomicrobiales bacterium]|nr:ATP-binding protein [Hyphomicrobiales bacterium]